MLALRGECASRAASSASRRGVRRCEGKPDKRNKKQKKTCVGRAVSSGAALAGLGWVELGAFVDSGDS